jgi:hypothetical protein
LYETKIKNTLKKKKKVSTPAIVPTKDGGSKHGEEEEHQKKTKLNQGAHFVMLCEIFASALLSFFNSTLTQ